jgi:hypothetical protein
MRVLLVSCCVLLAACGSSAGVSDRDLHTVSRAVARIGLRCDTRPVGEVVAVLRRASLDATVRLSDAGGRGRPTTLRRVATDLAAMLDACGQSAQASRLRAAVR